MIFFLKKLISNFPNINDFFSPRLPNLLKYCKKLPI
jgi:hypothetical protein